MKKKIISLAGIATAWLLEKLAGFGFYYVFFGWVIDKRGLCEGAILLFFIQLLGFVVFVYIYDFLSRDIFGVSAVKNRFRDRWERESIKHVWRRRVVLSLAFIAFTVQFSPPITTICLRKEGNTGLNLRSATILVSSVVVATLYWSFANEFIIQPIWRFFGLST